MNVSDIAISTKPLSPRYVSSAIALVLGLTILFGVGFAQGNNDSIHNAAHDTRHTMAFPCH
ncbi:MAG: CbtB-domain containing protein [Gammaproteobacteria bacterium]|nr:CbtB-domain containing protein [Gammaproteobacteria bacterium]MDH5802169.1 CbtB-domain containing protein [Gammaproteobacteria bacterium]